MKPKLPFEILAWVVIWFSFLAIFARANDSSSVERYVRWFHAETPKRLERALKLVPTVEFISRMYEVDPMLTAVIISCESSWKPSAVGSIGERGLMQVHGAAARGFDLSQPEGQIEAGVSWLRRGIRACGLNAKALAWYNGEGCVDRQYAKRRWRLYVRARREFR